MWNYLYFVLYLDTIPENDHNAIESYVLKQVSDCFVIYACMKLPKTRVKIAQ